MEFRSLRHAELEEWSQLCATVFGKDKGYFKNHFEDDPWGDVNGIFTAWDGGKIVGSVRVFTRRIYLGGEVVDMGGLGEVCTAGSHRRKGLSTVLIKMAIEYMERKPLPVSVLFTSVNPHYARCGWFTVPERFVNVALSPCDLPAGYGMRAVTPEDAAALAELHGKHAPAYSGLVVRDEAYWNSWIAKNCRERYIIENGEGVQAYLGYDIGEDSAISFRDYLGQADQLELFFGALAKRSSFTQLTRLPAPMLVGNKVYSEGFHTMLRLNTPFTLGGKTIDTSGKLAALAADFVFSPEDGF